jgi:hypothetical protein
MNNRLACTVNGLDLLRPKLGRVGIEAENELTLSFLNECCKSVPKGLRRGLD